MVVSRKSPLGQFPNACSGFGAGTCMPLSPTTSCGGEGQRACCFGQGDACQPGLVYRGDDLALDSFIPVSGDATCNNIVIAGSEVLRATGSCVRDNPGPIAEPTTGWSPAPEPRGVMAGYMDMHLHLLGHQAHGGRNLAGAPAPVDANGNFVADQAPDVNAALSPAPTSPSTGIPTTGS